ncbi:RNA polymerase II-associated protein 1 like protein [Daldinia childiae]|uniref:RNA polymerase II-associated protein 1 like protein n=1 Tax=Daldinia childiae TaxID=326645 RepID=UPI0014469289|nr:RNA polymerase II-associated protein 1 like protein [Daldinia childiae]KAF3064598.1 RNA polymerase II-associated protein 1 like protein [Daldinia childiae]
MASSSRSGEHRSVHQDFIARIRFSNALPPPPNPPKLLDIPNTGLASGQYTTPGFASRLAREQPLNIEADAELGMPLDLIGMPGIFDGDESSIQAPTQPPQIHPHDRALLRGPGSLGHPKLAEANVSFLRRTEYISSVTTKRHDGGALRSNNPAPKRPLKRPSPERDVDSPAHIKKKIDQGFAIAAANLKDKSRVKHPSKRNLKLVDAYPLVPDLEAFPDSGAYVTFKFTHNPLPATRVYDKRLLNGILKPISKTEAEEAAFAMAMQAHERDPQHVPKPQNLMDYDFFLNDNLDASERFRQKFDIENPDHDDDSLYTHKSNGKPNFLFPRVRTYETAQELELNNQTKYDEEVVLAFNDDEAIDQKAAFYYPVMQRSVIKPQRNKNIARTIGLVPADLNIEERNVDQLDVVVEDPSDDIRAWMSLYRDHPYGREDEGEGEEGEGGQSGHGDAEHRESNGRSTQQVEDEDEDQDAEGEED